MEFKKENIGHQSPWLAEIYNQYFSNVIDGFFVEIGVGFTANWQLMTKPWRIVPPDQLVRGHSNTIEFLEHGWSGLYIEPIKELLTNELIPLLDKILTLEQQTRVQFANCAVSDSNKVMVMGKDQELCGDSKEEPDKDFVPYDWKGRKVNCRKTSEILIEHNVPNIIDVMSIDVESHELYVLRGMDFSKHLPKLIIIETCITPHNKILEILPKEYKFIKGDSLNSVIINKNLL
ncbi:MAG TPA: FkbM family methyltransferase [Bacteroidales bacterium]|nr:FkbM family methyltransferase [Bacteroidales bacterium]